MKRGTIPTCFGVIVRNFGSCSWEDFTLMKGRSNDKYYNIHTVIGKNLKTPTIEKRSFNRSRLWGDTHVIPFFSYDPKDKLCDVEPLRPNLTGRKICQRLRKRTRNSRLRAVTFSVHSPVSRRKIKMKSDISHPNNGRQPLDGCWHISVIVLT